MYKTLSKHLQRGEGKDRTLSKETIAYEERKNTKLGAISSVHRGKIVKAKIINIVDYGAFVDVSGISGFVHITEISSDRISNIRNVLKVGSVYDFKVIEVGLNKKGLISLKLTKILDKSLNCEGVNKERNAFCNNPFSNLDDLIGNTKKR